MSNAYLVDGARVIQCNIRDITARRRIENQLRALALRVETAREQERAEVARDIHDVLGQQLTGLKMDVAWVLRRVAQSSQVGSPAVSERLQRILRDTDATIATVQRIATGLRPGVLHDLGLVAALRWQAREFEARSGVSVQLALPDVDPRVDLARATAVFRIFQELLTNVARHAEARRVQVRLAEDGGWLVLDVEDDGRGMADPSAIGPSSLGLLGVRERARAFGGELVISSRPGHGTQARVSVPSTSTGDAA